ncbi:hypothetical protein HZS_3648 [Henneguya salminicola]|nr:hypothetical protein HZS_3648 [Henneguya salminicola]
MFMLALVAREKKFIWVQQLSGLSTLLQIEVSCSGIYNYSCSYLKKRHSKYVFSHISLNQLNFRNYAMIGYRTTNPSILFCFGLLFNL